MSPTRTLTESEQMFEGVVNCLKTLKFVPSIPYVGQDLGRVTTTKKEYRYGIGLGFIRSVFIKERVITREWYEKVALSVTLQKEFDSADSKGIDPKRDTSSRWSGWKPVMIIIRLPILRDEYGNEPDSPYKEIKFDQDGVDFILGAARRHEPITEIAPWPFLRHSVGYR